MNAFPGTDRFEIRRCLGSGAFGTVYEACDRERRAVVALKVPHASTARALYLFKQEFRSLADLVHPNLVALFELLTDGERWFFTMERVEGLSWLDHLRDDSSGALGRLPTDSGEPFETTGHGLLSEWTAGGLPFPGQATEGPVVLPTPPRDPGQVRSALRQLSEGLLALHGAGLVHRDLKPPNVLVTAAGRVVILDFGLAAGMDEVLRGGSPGGTPAYMAPEQLAGRGSGPAADWYSVGVLLYQALTGRLPFSGDSRSLLLQKLGQDPLPPRGLLPGIPEDLDQLCTDLLSRDPETRLGGEKVLQRLRVASPSLPARKPAEASRLPLLVGRAEELGNLAEGFRLAREGRSVAALIHGTSGSGKSTLARAFLTELEGLDPRTVVLEGRCYEQETVPYKALDSLVDALSQHLKELPAQEARTLLPRNMHALARLFPVLNQVPLVGEQTPMGETPDAQELRRRAFGALREVLRRMVASHPVVLVIDDLQWGDRDSAALFGELLRPPDPPCLMLLLCYRDEDLGASEVLADLLPRLAESAAILQDVELRALPPEEAQALAGSLLDPRTPESGPLAEWIARESGGSPFFVQELAHYLRHGRMDPRQGGERRLDDYIRVRVAQLQPEPRRLLQTVALAGHPVEWGILQRALGDESGALSALSALRGGHLVRVRTADRRRYLETYHDRIRSAVVQSLPDGLGKELHLALARALEADPAPDAQALARHYEEAGLLVQAATYVLQAASQAEAALAFDQAALLYRKALALKPATGLEAGLMWRRLGDALANSGRSVDAAEAYLCATAGAPVAEANRLRRRAAEEFLRGGSMGRGLAVLEEVLAQVGTRLPRTRLGALWSVLRHRLRLKLRGLDYQERPEAEIPPLQLERVDTHWAAAMGLGPVDVLRAADFQTRQLLLTLECGEPFRVVRALAHETIVVAAEGNRSIAATRELQERMNRLAERIGHPNPRSRALLAAGIAATMLGRWQESAELLEQAEVMLKQHCTGMDYELHIAQHQGLLARFVAGDLRLVRERLPQVLQEAREKGDRIASANLRLSLQPLLDLMQDRSDLALDGLRSALTAWGYPSFQIQHYHYLTSRVNVELYRGDAAAAREVLENARAPLARSVLKRIQIARITLGELEARTLLAGTGRASAAQRYIDALRREQTAYGEALALKLEGVAAGLEGRRGEAHSLLTRAGRQFEACGMRLHAQVTHCGCGLLEEDAARIEAAHDWMKAQGIRNPERFVAMHLPLRGGK